jgi:hypothetical protein
MLKNHLREEERARKRERTRKNKEYSTWWLGETGCYKLKTYGTYQINAM